VMHPFGDRDRGLAVQRLWEFLLQAKVRILALSHSLGCVLLLHILHSRVVVNSLVTFPSLLQSHLKTSLLLVALRMGCLGNAGTQNALSHFLVYLRGLLTLDWR
jgi:hypothetical protein